MSREATKVISRIRTATQEAPSLSTTVLRSIRRQVSKEIRGLKANTVLEVAFELITLGGTYNRFLACELVLHHKKTTEALDSKKVVRLGAGIDSWADVDIFASYIAGPAWREHRIPSNLVVKWARSKDRWWRRAALVSTVPLNNKARGGTGDTFRTLKVCQLAVRDRDDMVAKALSWALRELSKRDKAAVKNFLNQNISGLHPRVIREVNNKLRTGLKTPL